MAFGENNRITLERFLARVKELNLSNLNKTDWRRSDKKPLDPKDSLKVEWCTGGQRGGSCWDEGEHSYYAHTGDPEEELESLDVLLEDFCPDISHLKYKNLIRKVIKRKERHEDDYYGNYSNYASKEVILEELYNTLIEMKLI